MSFQVFGLPVSRGVAIGRAVLVASSRVDVAHYFIDETQVEAEIDRLRAARDAVATELGALQRDMPAEAPPELSALLDVHLMLLHDETLTGATKHWIRDAPLQRRMGAVGAARGAGAPVRRDGGRVPARAQGRPGAGGRARAARAGAGSAARCAPAPRQRRATSAAKIRWCWWPTTSRRPTCCSSSAACSPASSPTSAARPRTPRSWRAAWTFRRWWVRARPVA